MLYLSCDAGFNLYSMQNGKALWRHRGEEAPSPTPAPHLPPPPPQSGLFLANRYLLSLLFFLRMPGLWDSNHHCKFCTTASCLINHELSSPLFFFLSPKMLFFASSSIFVSFNSQLLLHPVLFTLLLLLCVLVYKPSHFFPLLWSLIFFPSQKFNYLNASGTASITLTYDVIIFYMHIHH